jgi:hypothetical protein
MARHCDELVRRGPRPEERAELVAAWRLDCARLLARELAALLPGDKLSVTLGEPEMLRGSDLLARVGPVAANSLLRCGDSSRTALLSFDCATAIALTDRSFGGDGEIDRDAPLPEQLPRSAVLLIDRVAAIAARALVERLAGAVVLKGAGSLVAAPGAAGGAELLGLCAHGNPGMASAGMGDVLSGVIGALLAQGLGPGAAAAAGACLHSYAADRAAGVLGERGLLATDLLEHLLDILRREAPLAR